MLIVASVNGAIREALLIPRMGDLTRRAVSTLSLCVLIISADVPHDPVDSAAVQP
jgi:hypothetical protein